MPEEMQQQRLWQNQTVELKEINSIITNLNTKIALTYVCSFKFTNAAIHITERKVEEHKIIQNRHKDI